MKILYDYDKDHDILFVHWGEEGTEYSEESEDGKVVLDIDKKGRIVGIEIFNWSKKRKSQAYRKGKEAIERIRGRWGRGYVKRGEGNECK